MKAPRGLDRLYRNLCLDRRLDELMLRLFGGPDGLAAAGALLKAQRAIRIASGRASKMDRKFAAIEARHTVLQQRTSE